MGTEFNLGDKVRCKANGHEGIVYGHTEFLHSVDSYCVRAQGLTPDGNLFKAYYSEATELELVEAGAVPQ